MRKGNVDWIFEGSVKFVDLGSLNLIDPAKKLLQNIQSERNLGGRSGGECLGSEEPLGGSMGKVHTDHNIPNSHYCSWPTGKWQVLSSKNEEKREIAGNGKKAGTEDRHQRLWSRETGGWLEGAG